MDKITKNMISWVLFASKFIKKNPQINQKDDKGDLVTSYDLKIEKFLIKKIKDNYPNFDIISEEFNPEKIASENYFLIDPIDGTVNFSNNIPHWGIQMACIKDNNICAAVIYLPTTKELFYADKSGAFKNDKKIILKENISNKNLFAIISGKKKKIVLNVSHYRHLGCSCATYGWFLNNSLGGVAIYSENLLKDWDTTPGFYIATRAGATVLSKCNVHALSLDKNIAKELIKKSKTEDR